MPRQLALAAVTILLSLSSCGGGQPASNLAGAPGANQSDAQRDAEVAQAFSEPPTDRRADDKTRDEVEAMLEAIGTNARRGYTDNVLDQLDLETMLQVAEKDGDLGLRQPGDRKKFFSGIREGFAKSINGPASSQFKYFGVRVTRVNASSDGRILLAYARHDLDGEGSLMKVRWWLIRSDKGWRVYDWENLNNGVRMSTTLMNMLPQARMNTVPPWLRRMEEFGTARAVVEQGDFKSGRQRLNRLESAKLPDSLEAMRLLYLGICESSEGKYDKAIALYNRALKLKPDLPDARYLRGCALGDMGKFEESIVDYQWYLDTLGSDAECYRRMGNSYSWLDKHEEAAKAYRASLEDRPSREVIVSLAGYLKPEECDVLGRYFLALREPKQEYEPLVRELLDENRLYDATRAINTAFAPMAKGNHDYVWYAAKVALYDKKPGDAAELLRPVLGRVKADDRQAYQSLFWDAMLKAGKAAEALSEAKDKVAAFEYLAGELYSLRDADRLDEICEAWRKGNEKAPALHFYLGEADFIRKAWKEAETHFEAGYKLLEGDDWRLGISNGWADSLYQQGRAVEAYGKIPPAEARFSQLAGYCIGDNKPDVLHELIEVHAKAVPNDPLLPRFRAELAYLKADFKAASDGLHAFATAHPKRSELEWEILERLVRSSLRANLPERAIDWAQRGFEAPSHWLEMLVHIHAGRPDRLETAMSKQRAHVDDDEWFAEQVIEFYDDPDVGEKFRGEAFAKLHAQYPPPPKPEPDKAQPPEPAPDKPD